MKNQTEKAVLKEEIKTISHTNKINEQKYIDIVNKRFELWHQSLQTCVRLFKTTTSYKKIQLIETSKIKREKGVSQEDISLIYQEINDSPDIYNMTSTILNICNKLLYTTIYINSFFPH